MCSILTSDSCDSTGIVKMVTLQGKPRVSKKQLSELQFNFQIESISKHRPLYSFATVSMFANKTLCRLLSVCLQDSVLAFHKHGMQGRSFKNGEVTQEISDPSRTYRLLGSDKYVSDVKEIVGCVCGQNSSKVFGTYLPRLN